MAPELSESGTSADAGGLLGLDVLQRGQPEGQGLARASGGNTHEVAPALNDGPALRLDGRRLREGRCAVQQLLAETWQGTIIALSALHETIKWGLFRLLSFRRAY